MDDINGYGFKWIRLSRITLNSSNKRPLKSESNAKIYLSHNDNKSIVFVEGIVTIL